MPNSIPHPGPDPGPAVAREWDRLLGEVETLAELDLADYLSAAPRLPLDAVRGRPVSFHTPDFRHYESEELPAARAHWPALSITGPDCRLQCDHCKGGVLANMIPVTTPALLRQRVRQLVEEGATGFLLTGGSSLQNEVPYAPFWPVLAELRREFPHLRMACHTALMDEDSVACMTQAGIDIAMLDVIGARDTLRQVYHLRREVADFEETLALLVASPLRVVPHIVLGLHYGYLLGEWQALEMVARWRPDALVLVVAMPFFAHPRRPFRIPHPAIVGRFFCHARRRLPDLPLLLGCARPPGLARHAIDALAVMAGFDGLAQPAAGIVELAARAGRPVRVVPACCSTLVPEADAGEVLDLATLLARRVDPPRAASVRVAPPAKAARP